jgi:SAM-dependent methyltransferase
VSWIFVGLAVLFVLSGLRNRKRLSGLARLRPSEEPVSPEHRFLVAPGVILDEAARRAASAYARAQGLEALDLIPADWPTAKVMGLAFLVDGAHYRHERFAFGHTAGHALLATSAVLERSGLGDASAPDALELVRIAARLKQYACTATDMAIAPGLRAVPDDPGKRRAILREVLGNLSVLPLIAPPLLFLVLALGVVFALPGGGIALGLFHLEPLIAIPPRLFSPRDFFVAVPLRSLLEIWGWCQTVLGRWRPDEPDPVESRRPAYAALLSEGVTPFFEPRRERCPLCESGELRVCLRTTDLIQHKPGSFTLERCAACGLIFQNPRLSLRGLDFYYRDFYDGLGAPTTAAIFGTQTGSYLARALMLEGVVEPRRWLDVGGGHGHFCSAARDIWPDTRFDGLDFGSSIEEGARRGWVDRAHSGLFPDLAPGLRGDYDVVSMSHYLEHTRDPRAEIAAAHTALSPGGHLLIEVPDPESRLGRILGRYWIPWFQPQHQHFLGVAHLERLLREQSFTPVVWHRREAHQKVDFFVAALLFLGRVAPTARRPWRPSPAGWQRVLRAVVWSLGSPLLLLGQALDASLAPILRRPGSSNTYRVLARRD